ncbi:MAG: hypothetical protein IJU75_03110 [Clostridia bacterium]|nr:hypothetical protein [Clostridia bacterium]
MKRITIILASIVLVLAILNGCMIGRTNPSSTGQEPDENTVFISRAVRSLLDAPVDQKEIKNRLNVDPDRVVWIASIDGFVYGIGFTNMYVISGFKLFGYTFETASSSLFLRYDTNNDELIRLTRENEEDFITEEQAKKLFDIAKNADWKNKVPETNAN